MSDYLDKNGSDLSNYFSNFTTKAMQLLDDNEDTNIPSAPLEMIQPQGCSSSDNAESALLEDKAVEILNQHFQSTYIELDPDEGISIQDILNTIPDELVATFFRQGLIDGVGCIFNQRDLLEARFTNYKVVDDVQLESSHSAQDVPPISYNDSPPPSVPPTFPPDQLLALFNKNTVLNQNDLLNVTQGFGQKLNSVGKKPKHLIDQYERHYSLAKGENRRCTVQQCNGRIGRDSDTLVTLVKPHSSGCNNKTLQRLEKKVRKQQP